MARDCFITHRSKQSLTAISLRTISWAVPADVAFLISTHQIPLKKLFGVARLEGRASSNGTSQEDSTDNQPLQDALAR